MMLMAKRQRAMLGEMGIRVWQPAPVVPPTAQSKVAIDTVAAHALDIPARVPSDAKKPPVQAPAKPLNPVNPLAKSAPIEPTSSADAWRVGGLQTLYSDLVAANTGSQPNPNRWLVLLEQPEAALQTDFNALAGDAGKLLDNMLRAAKLHTAAVVMLAPLVRAGESGTGGNLPSALTELLASANADVVVVMGRLAAQALLQSAEPLPALRSRVHTVQNQQCIVTFAPSYLLGNPLEKAKAWDDLCLGLSVARRLSTP